MKELGIALDINTGLRAVDDTGPNSKGLIKCVNIVSRIQGLVRPDIVLQSIKGIKTSYPFPQVFIGFRHWLCCTEDKIYKVNGDLSTTLLVDVGSYYRQFPSAPKGTWHFADFFTYGVLTNGGVTLVFNTQTNMWEYNDGLRIPTLGTVINFSGQIIGSGRDYIIGDQKTRFHDTDSAFLLWGGIGSADFSIDLSNVRGFRPMPFTGEIYKVLPLDIHTNNGYLSVVVVYGSGGICICKFNDNHLGIMKTYKYGIASRDAVSGDNEKHVFIDVNGNLRTLDSALNMSSPMFWEFFIPMLGKEIIVNYNPNMDDYYITDGSVSYLLTHEGLCEINEVYTSLVNIANTLIGFKIRLNNIDTELTTDIVDFGNRSLKTVDVIEIGVISDGEISVRVDYRHSVSDDFQSTPWKRVNSQGNVVFPVTGMEFRISILGINLNNIKLSSLTARVKFDDKRFIRGQSSADKITS